MVDDQLVAANKIVGRVDPLRLLEGVLASKEPEFLAVYGRRRVGKTYLIRSYFEERSTFFELTGRVKGTLRMHLALFAESLSDAFLGGVPSAPPRSWHDAFQSLRTAVEQRARGDRKIVLFFDELPWLATRRGGLLEELELFWNRHASRMRHVVLIVCGSAASWMLQKVVHARGGLHRRLTRTLRLLPFSLPETTAYLEWRGLRFTLDEVVELYMTLGGVPHYLRLLEQGESIAQNIDRLCFGRSSPLRGELDEVFASLFDHADSHRRMVEVLARQRGGMAMNDALDAAHMASGGGATRLITALDEAGFISSHAPFGRSSRNRLLRVTDPFSLFAVRWMRSGRTRRWSQLRGSPSWHAWAGLAFEMVCLEHIPAIQHALGISGVQVEASPWHHRGADGGAGAQIDLLLDRADNVISVCEMKFTEGPFAVDKRYAEDLRRKLAVFREETGTRKALRLVLVSARGLRRSRWSDSLVDAIVTLEDLFATPRGLR
jgi:hypothetical protein